MRRLFALGSVLIVIGLGLGLWAYAAGSLVWVGIALAAWWTGSALLMPNPLAEGLTAFEWTARAWRLLLVALLPPLALLVVLPSWQSGLATFNGNIYLTQFEVPFWTQTLNARQQAPSVTDVLELPVGLLLMGGWPMVTVFTLVLALGWAFRLPALSTRQRLHWLGYAGMLAMIALVGPAVTRFNTWLMD